MRIGPENLPKAALDLAEVNKKYIKGLKKRKPKGLDLLMQDLHDQEFEQMDCLTCANCCKTTSPMFTDKDISTISKKLRMKEVDFVKTYLRMDEDGFMVLQSAPCTFLNDDNSCSIYEFRPKACKEYPHTNRKKFLGIADLTLKNAEICPAVFHILEELKKKLPI